MRFNPFKEFYPYLGIYQIQKTSIEAATSSEKELALLQESEEGFLKVDDGSSLLGGRFCT